MRVLAWGPKTALVVVLAASFLLLMQTSTELRTTSGLAASSSAAAGAPPRRGGGAAAQGSGSTRSLSTAAAAAAAAAGEAAAAPVPAPARKTHKLCVLSRVHNQPRSLAEWLEYHAALGVGRFFLVDDCSTDEGKTRTVMDVYEQEGLVKYYTAEDVTRKQCPHVLTKSSEAQELAARWERRRLARLCQAGGDEGVEEGPLEQKDARFERDIYVCGYKCGGGGGGRGGGAAGGAADKEKEEQQQQKKHKPDERRLFRFLYEAATDPDADEACEWLMVFDTDEYITIEPDAFPEPDIAAFIAEHEQRTGGFPILRFPWVMMGSEGHETRPPGLLVDNFHHGFFARWMVKTAGKAEYLDTIQFSHWPLVKHVSNETSMAEHGFAIPAPFPTLRNYTERNTMNEPYEARFLNVMATTGKAAGKNTTCMHPGGGVFVKHYFFRSFEEYKAHRVDTRLKSDGAVDKKILGNPRAAWGEGTHPGMFAGPCSRTYSNDFTALMADKTRAALAARKARWDAGWRRQRQQSQQGDGTGSGGGGGGLRGTRGSGGDFESWLVDGQCGRGPRHYTGPFPPIDEWVI